MGVMTTITMNYVVNPLAGFWKRVKISLEIIGYARAAGELQRMGLHKQSHNCILRIKELKASN